MGLRNSIGRWPKQVALILTDRESSMTMLIRDLLRKFSWKAAETRFPDCDYNEVFAHLKAGAAPVIIVDDSENLPSGLICRHLIQECIALMTPAIVLVNEANRSEYEAIVNLGPFEVVQKPITLGNFNAAFERLMKRWSTGPFDRLRGAGYDMVNGNEKSALAALIELNQHAEMAGLVAPCLARFFMGKGDTKAAEKILLAGLRNSPKHLGIMLTLTELYLHQGLVHLAKKILANVERLYLGALTPICDKIQTAVMQNQTDLCVAYFQEMTQRHFATELAMSLQPRCLMAEGLHAEFEKIMKSNGPLASKYRAVWGGRSQMAG